MVVIEGVVEKVVFYNPDSLWIVMKVNTDEGIVTAVGEAVEINTGSYVKLEGKWVYNYRYGKQFKFYSFVELLPEDSYAVEKYLSSSAISGVGPVIARRIVEKFGAHSIEIIEKEPEKLLEVEGIGKVKLEKILSSYNKSKEIRSLLLYFSSFGISLSLALKLYRRYGVKAKEVVEEDPYRLAMEVQGIGFLTADNLAKKLGIDKYDIRRLKAGLLFVLFDYSNKGDLFVDKTVLMQEASSILDVDSSSVEVALDKLVEESRVVIDDSYCNAVYLRPLFLAEKSVARRIVALSRFKRTKTLILNELLSQWEQKEKIFLNEEQRKAIVGALGHSLSVITGGPGTGKTTIIKAIIEIAKKLGFSVQLAAPTGRAAQRIYESSGYKAKTIHRLLEFDPVSRRFLRDEKRALKADMVIVDESSMIDIFIASALLKAIPKDGSVVFVGDVNQLPPVGPGDFFSAIVNSGIVPVFRLKKVFRQKNSSLIVANAHNILDGKIPRSDKKGEGDFFIFKRNSPDEIYDTVKETIENLKSKGFGAKDIQLLVPTRRGSLGVVALNRFLKTIFNDKPKEENLCGFSVGDKVIQVKNNYYLEVFNGDVGVVVGVDIEQESLEVDFDGRVVVYRDSDIDELELAYAISVHKSQGSEYPVAIVVLHTQHFVMLRRSLIYTAITRGKKMVILITNHKALRRAVFNASQEKRKTLLVERIRGAISSAIH